MMAAGGGLMQDRTQFAAGGMYPMSQQDHTQFASSPQMPASMQATMAGYEPNTNPLTGEPTAHMADGGSVGQFDVPLSAPKGYVLDPSGMYKVDTSQQPQQYAHPFLQAMHDSTTKFENLVRGRSMAGGGIASLGSYSDGGRMLKGPGDGMSDSIPATIGRKQPARLADNEFVVPADVVSHLGNGSSDAGAKKLYAMMNNVRKARTGKKKQAPQINAAKYMPA
jgi:hypothetical protein